MVEGNDKNNLPEGGSGAAMPPVPAFTPGIVWKAMGFFWQFPDWHGARGRGKKAGWVFRHKMIDADEPESVLAERTLAEIRSLLSGVIGCASLYRSNLAPNLSGYAKLNRAIQAMCEINKKSLALHDRVRLILPLSSQIEGDCIICALFRTFRSLVLTRIFDDECGTPNEWNASLMTGGNNSLLGLLRRFEAAGSDATNHVIHLDDLKRFSAFAASLMNMAGNREESAAVAVSPLVVQGQEQPTGRSNAESTPVVNVAVINQVPVTVSQNNEPVMIGAVATGNTIIHSNADDEKNEPEKKNAAATGTDDTQDGGDVERKPKSATGDTAIADNQGDTTGTREPVDAAEVATGNSAAVDSRNDGKKSKTRKGHKGKRTAKYLQYHVLRVLYDMFNRDPDATLTADELFQVLHSQKVECLDTIQCHRAIDDLRNLFKHEHVGVSIPEADYRLVKGRYLHSTRIEKVLDSLKQEAKKRDPSII